MKKRSFIIVVALLFAVACEKAPINPIPDYQVRLELNLMFQDRGLLDIYTYKEFTRPRYETDRLGFGGILVVHGLNWEFYAYDLACPNEVSPDVKIEVTDGGLSAKCPECGSVYDIMGGGARLSGPSEYHLKRYRVTPIGNDELIVSN